jgi:plastocyanin
MDPPSSVFARQIHNAQDVGTISEPNDGPTINPDSSCAPNDQTCSSPGDIGGGPPVCDPQDPSCSDNGGTPPPGDIGGVPPCDPQDPSCSDNGGTPPPGDIGGVPPCDPTDPSCSGVPPCDPTDPSCSGVPPCDPTDPSCVITPCDPQDPLCVITPCVPEDPLCIGNPVGNPGPSCNPDNPACPEAPGAPSPICDDGVDNDRNGAIDDECRGGPGGPSPTLFPGGVASTPNGPSPIGDPNILGVAFQSNLLPGSAEAALTKENICNDGIDNDHNGLKDSEDPSCSVPELSPMGIKLIPGSIGLKTNANSPENKTFDKSKVTNSYFSMLDSNEVNTNTVIISITGTDNAQTPDIRTVSMHYKYSQERISIDKGTKVMWVNDDPTQAHGINLIDKLSGKIIYSYPVIRPGNSAYYIFENPGQYIYTDPKFMTMTGLITVLS